MMTFGTQLEKLRKSQQMTQEEMGEKFGVCASTLSNYERGVHQPDLEFIEKAANYFGVSIDYMFGKTAFQSPIDQLNVQLSDNLTAGEFLNIVLDYDHSRLERLLSYVDYLSSDYSQSSLQGPAGAKTPK